MPLQCDSAREILAFLKAHSLTVLSYADAEGRPHSATVEYVVTDDGDLIFCTFAAKRKYQLLIARPAVAVVVGWDYTENVTVQYEGVAREVEEAELEQVAAYYFGKLPDAKAFADSFAHLGRLAFFVVRPTWIRFSDFNTDPWTVVESAVR